MTFAAVRRNMVESQLRTNRVNDEELLAAFDAVPREVFVPEHLRGVAYVDDDLEIAPGRYLMEPMVLARLLQAAAPGPEEVALIVGCGTGYSSAIMARLANTVVALESDAELGAQATQNLADLSIDNVVVLEGALVDGHAAQAPYDVVLVDGGVEEMPETIERQLAEGGRLVTVMRRGAVGHAVLMSRLGGAVSRRVLFDAAVPTLPGFVPEPGFVF